MTSARHPRGRWSSGFVTCDGERRHVRKVPAVFLPAPIQAKHGEQDQAARRQVPERQAAVQALLFPHYGNLHDRTRAERRKRNPHRLTYAAAALLPVTAAAISAVITMATLSAVYCIFLS